ncbi:MULTISPECIES: glycerophosphoryl diester phosphodiesterase [unclassified Vibrio]|uniref:glycerophosphoryl diester phosphodiesterase n=1 Tax=unclassified Vibrio TaxID=2614977 RepID=UPI000B29B717|nr:MULTISPECIES: glycerophosphoryl diester phosphodiesterase [unclassified Vibrio]
MCKTIAHRGLSSQAPENTLSAFKLAVEKGSRWIEIDVQLSRDGVPVVIHDETVNRCTNGRGLIREMTLSQLKVLDAGLWFGDKFQNEPIPTLLETLQFIQQANVSLNIELKIYPDDDIALLCSQVAKIIEASGIAENQLLFSSFETSALALMQARLPEIRRGQLWHKIPRNALSVLQALDAYSVHCDYRFLTQNLAQEVKKGHYQLYCYTPNFPELVEQHWLWGVDMMITDIPQAYTALQTA